MCEISINIIFSYYINVFECILSLVQLAHMEKVRVHLSLCTLSQADREMQYKYYHCKILFYDVKNVI